VPFGYQVALSTYYLDVDFWQGGGCARNTSALKPPPHAHITHSFVGLTTVLSGAGTTGQRCKNVRPLLAAARRLPLVTRARHPPPGHVPHTTPQLVERPLQLEVVSKSGPVGRETWTTRRAALPEGYARVSKAPSRVPLETARIAEMRWKIGKIRCEIARPHTLAI
jgi:hypothetical protein